MWLLQRTAPPAMYPEPREKVEKQDSMWTDPALQYVSCRNLQSTHASFEPFDLLLDQAAYPIFRKIHLGQFDSQSLSYQTRGHFVQDVQRKELILPGGNTRLNILERDVE